MTISISLYSQVMPIGNLMFTGAESLSRENILMSINTAFAILISPE